MVFRRGNRLRPINSLKHTVDIQNTVPAGSATVSDLIVGTASPPTTTANAVEVSSAVNSIFLNIQVVPTVDAVGTINNAYMYIIMNPAGIYDGNDIPAVNNVGTSNLRKQIFHQDMVMLSDANDSIPSTLFKGVLKIPKKARRVGVDDHIQVVVGTPVGGAEINACIQCIYKEYR